jgi:hypothetical protein
MEEVGSGSEYIYIYMYMYMQDIYTRIYTRIDGSHNRRKVGRDDDNIEAKTLG